MTIVVTAASGCAEPGYSHLSQYISELGADGAAHGALVSRAGFAAIGAACLAFSRLLRRAQAAATARSSSSSAVRIARMACSLTRARVAT